jgi:hypothetical protein
MQADTLEELHAIGEQLGLRRAWFQSKPGKPWHDHYDLTRARREQAIALGVIPVSWREAARRNQQVRLAHARAQRSAPPARAGQESDSSSSPSASVSCRLAE